MRFMGNRLLLTFLLGVAPFTALAAEGEDISFTPFYGDAAELLTSGSLAGLNITPSVATVIGSQDPLSYPESAELEAMGTGGHLTVDTSGTPMGSTGMITMPMRNGDGEPITAAGSDFTSRGFYSQPYMEYVAGSVNLTNSFASRFKITNERDAERVDQYSPGHESTAAAYTEDFTNRQLQSSITKGYNALPGSPPESVVHNFNFGGAWEQGSVVNQGGTGR